MDIVKKNIISIVCGVVALIAVAVAFTVVSSKAKQLQADLDARKAAHDQLAALMTKDRTLPTVDPEKTEAEKLKGFPSDSIIKQGEAITKEVETESINMREAAKEMNKHELLIPGSLPAPTNPIAYNFRSRYMQYFPVVAPAGGGPGQGGTAAPGGSMLNSQFAKDLNAGMPPTPEDITAQAAALSTQITSKRLRTLNGAAVNQEQVNLEIAEETRKLPIRMRDEIAEKSKVYINNGTFQPYANVLQGNGAPDPVDIYMAQLTLWIQQDVVNAVKECNANAKSIKDAPVKHLISINAPPNFIVPASGTPAGDPDAAVPKEYPMSPTGRVCNGMYDVFQFDLDADVEAAKLPDFLRALGHNRFITPLWVDVKSVDNAVEMAAGRVYGNSPVVNVHMRCEDLYLRKWNAPFMPKNVRTRLAVPEEQPQQAAPAGEQPPGAPATPTQPAAAAQ